MKLPKWIVTDLDGTLLLDDSTIAQRSLDAINKIRALGVKFGIATTRSKSFAQQYIDILKPDAMALSGGAVGYMEDKLVYKKSLTKDQIEPFFKEFETNLPLKKVVINTLDHRYESIQEVRSLSSYEILSIFIWTDEKSDLSLLENSTKEISFSKLWRPLMFRISNVMGTKHNALQYLLKDIDPKEVVTFGDDPMDVGMLSHFNGVAVANAFDEVKAATNNITLSNEDQGVANWLEKLISQNS
ncbi:MAG: HAD family hydrolase [Sphaerochaetaceae bacterium]|jgi:hydroxymethylpyrimidine pyrophosphatase-like HAD family hydrolase